MKIVILSLFVCSAAMFGAQPAGRSVTLDLAASGNSTTARMSPDTNTIFFQSDASNLLPGAAMKPWMQIYRREVSSGNLILVSVSSSGEPADGNCVLLAVSTNGRLVTFVSDAPNLVPGDENGSQDLFLRDLESGTTAMITTNAAGSASVQLPSSVGTVLMSHNGEWVFYESTASQLTPEADTNGGFDTFGFHRASGTNQLIVRSATNPLSSPQAGTRLLDTTPNGSNVVFLSSSGGDIAPGVSSVGAQVFVREMSSGNIQWVSQLQSFLESNYECANASISEDGKFVAFTTTTGTNSSMLFRADVVAGSVMLVSSNVVRRIPLISADGGVIVYEDGTNVYRWMPGSGAALVNVTTAGAAPANGTARDAAMTPDGQHVCFCSDAPGLTSSSPSGVFQIYCRNFITGETWLVTQTPVQSASTEPTDWSAINLVRDGSAIAFESAASDLTADDHNRALDVFLRLRDSSAASLVSYRAESEPRKTALGYSTLASSSVSSNGTHVTFTSWDIEGVATSSKWRQNAFVSDVENGIASPLGTSDNVRGVAISADGRYVAAYVTSVTNTENMARLSRFDLTDNSELVLAPEAYLSTPFTVTPGISSDGNLIATSSSGRLRVYNVAAGTNEYWWNVTARPMADFRLDAVISGDSRFVAFANNNLMLYDRASGVTETLAGSHTSDAAISGDSKYLAFLTSDGSPSAASVVRRHLLRGTNEVVGQKMRSLAISADGRFIVGEDAPPSANRLARTQIVLLNCDTKRTNIISVSSSAQPGDGRSQYPVISANGRFVAYMTDASNIVPGNPPDKQQVVLRDVLLGQTILLSASTSGSPGNDHSGRPYISADGRTIVFQSMASNLTPGDYNNARDIFIVRIGEADSDNDDMDDGWEATYFGNLSRDGNGDMDEDGATDRAEFLAGTDPSNSGSLFRVITISQVGAPGRMLVWTGDQTRAYRVEYKDDLGTADWNTLQSPIQWNGSTARTEDPTAPSMRFYRVVRIP